MAKPRKSLDNWLNEVLDDPEQEAKASRVVLMHMIGQQSEEHYAIKVKPGKMTPKAYADLLRDKAETYSAELPGIQTFGVWVFYGEAQNPGQKYIFLVNNSQPNPGDLATEGPHGQGLVQQAMRHTEQILQQTYAKQNALDSVMNRMVETLGTRLHESESENREMFKIMCEVIREKVMDSHTREMEIRKLQSSAVMKERLLEMAPALLNQVTGKEIFPQSTVDTTILKKIALSIEPEALQGIIGSGAIKDPALLGLLMDRFTQIQKEENERQARIAAIRPKDTALIVDPEADAAGDPQPNILPQRADH